MSKRGLEKGCQKKLKKVLDISWKQWYPNRAVANSTANSKGFLPESLLDETGKKQIEKEK